MPTTYVVLDTNILFRIITQGQPGCEMERWGELMAFIDNVNVWFLLPEVIKWEFGKLMRGFEGTVELKLKKLESMPSGIPEPKDLWNEIHDLLPVLQNARSVAVENWKLEKFRAAKTRHSHIEPFFAENKVKVLEFTHEDMFNAKKRMIAGKYPDGEKPKQLESNLFIIEALRRFFSDKPDSQLLLCSENHPDFGVELKDGRYVLHPVFKDGLPPTECFINLQSMLTFIREKKKVEEPKLDELTEAVQRDINKRIDELEKAKADLDRKVALHIVLQAEALARGRVDYAGPHGWTIVDGGVASNFLARRPQWLIDMVAEEAKSQENAEKLAGPILDWSKAQPKKEGDKDEPPPG